MRRGILKLNQRKQSLGKGWEGGLSGKISRRWMEANLGRQNKTRREGIIKHRRGGGD